MDIRSIFSDAGFAGIRAISTSLLSIALIPIITNILGADAFGIWKTVLAFTGLVTVTCGVHLHGSLIRYTDDNDDQVFIDILLLSLIIGVVISLLTLGIGELIISLFKVGFLEEKILIPIAIFIGARIPGQILKNYPRAQKRLKIFEAINFFQSVLKYSSLIIVFFYTEKLLYGFWTIAVISILIDLVLVIFFLPNRFTLSNLSNYHKYLRYGLPMLPQQLASKLLDDADKYIIIFYLGPTAAGYYAVAYSVANIISKSSMIFNGTLYPRVTTSWDNNELGELSSFYTKFTRWYGVVAIPMVVGLSLLTRPVLEFASTAEVAQNTYLLLPLLACGFAFQGLVTPYTYVLAAAERTPLIGKITIGATILNIIMNLLAIPLIGTAGAALATIFSHILIILVMGGYLKGYLSYEIEWEYLVKSVVSSTGMAIILIYLPINSNFHKMVFYPLLGASIFFSFFVLFRGISRKDMEKISSYLRA